MLSSVDNRSVSPVVGTILMIAVVVVIAATVGVTMLGFSDDLRDLTAPMTYGDNLVENPGFEDGNANWEDGEGNLISADKIVGGEGTDGSKAIQLSSNEGSEDYAGQNLDAVLLPDAEYRLCAQSRLDSADSENAGGFIGVQHEENGTAGPETHLTTWEVTSESYRNQCQYFKADRKLENITVWVYVEDGASISADDFVLQRTRFLTDAR